VLGDAGGVPREELFRTFNMGVGMCVLCDPSAVDAVIASARAAAVPAWVMGHVATGSGRVVLR
jgi:phosphoribosylformylglycinamidine cyclo-ligase